MGWFARWTGRMPMVWTTEKLLELDPVRLERLRQNALTKGETDLAQHCVDIQQTRKAKLPSTNRPKDPVVGFHFVCKGDYEVTEEADGSFRSGVWAVDSGHCDPAIELGGYVALHDTKQVASYRQGTIIGWTLKPRSKGSTAMGVEFHLSPIRQGMSWYGRGAGERGYRRVSDEPRWAPGQP
jgi:hypothetical protein